MRNPGSNSTTARGEFSRWASRRWPASTRACSARLRAVMSVMKPSRAMASPVEPKIPLPWSQTQRSEPSRWRMRYSAWKGLPARTAVCTASRTASRSSGNTHLGPMQASAGEVRGSKTRDQEYLLADEFHGPVAVVAAAVSHGGGEVQRGLVPAFSQDPLRLCSFVHVHPGSSASPGPRARTDPNCGYRSPPGPGIVLARSVAVGIPKKFARTTESSPAKSAGIRRTTDPDQEQFRTARLSRLY